MFTTETLQNKKLKSFINHFIIASMFFGGLVAANASQKEGYRWGPEFGLGLSSLSGDSVAVDRSKSGYHLFLSADLERYSESHLFEASLGFMYNYFQTSDGIATLKTVPVKLELGYRYRFGNGWQIGPAFPLFFATDVSFSENPEIFVERQQQFAIFFGARLSKEVSFWDLDWRIGAHLFTDLNVSDRQVYLMGLTLALELPFSKAKEPEPLSEPTPVAAEPVATEEEPLVQAVETPVAAPSPIATVTPVKDILLNLDSSVMQFKVDVAQLDGKKPELIRALGLFLAKNPFYWKTIRVYGHADSTGDAGANQKLSEERAAYVAGKLVKAGIDRSQIQSRGFGSTRPIDSAELPEAWAKNRRVEVYLDGTKKPDEFVQSLNSYLDKVMAQLGMHRN